MCDKRADTHVCDRGQTYNHTCDKRAGTHTRMCTCTCTFSLTHTPPLCSLKCLSPKPYRQLSSLQCYCSKLKLKRCNLQNQPKSKDQKRLYPLPVSLVFILFPNFRYTDQSDTYSVRRYAECKHHHTAPGTLFD